MQRNEFRASADALDLYRPHIMITNTALFGFLFVLKKTAAI
jgi:hypothetical protein